MVWLQPQTFVCVSGYISVQAKKGFSAPILIIKPEKIIKPLNERLFVKLK